MTLPTTQIVFDYRSLRLLMGLIALALPFAVSLIAASSLSSISASYHTNARDVFVGLLFFVSAFLWAYNGHSPTQALFSRVASLAAIGVALFPTACDICETNLTSIIHYGAAVTLFSILAYFCFRPFQAGTRGQTGKKGRRSKIYFICGWIMIICMAAALLGKIPSLKASAEAIRLTYWAEAIALGAFGVAWIVAGKFIRLFVDEDEKLHLRKQREDSEKT